MEKYRRRLLAGLVLVLVAQFRITVLSDNVKYIISAELEQNNDFKRLKSKIFLTLNDPEQMSDYEVKRYIGSRAQGVAFDVMKSNELFVAKVILDADADFSFCRREKVVEELNLKGISYVASLKHYHEYTSKDKNPEVFSCVLIYDRSDDTITNPKLFTKNDIKGKIENSKQLFVFFGKAIQAFTEINLKKQVLHGNITPESIMVNFKQIDNNSDRDFEPVVVDFCFSLKNEQFKFISDKLFRYSDGFRPSEMIEKTEEKETTSTQNQNKNQNQKNDKEKEKEQKKLERENWNKNWEKYTYSKEFVEDVYALGKTIEKVLDIQNRFIDESQCEIESLRKIAKLMLKKREELDLTVNPSSEPKKYIKVRMNMREITVKFIEKVNDCDKSQSNTKYQLFIKQATESINSFRIPFILI